MTTLIQFVVCVFSLVNLIYGQDECGFRGADNPGRRKNTEGSTWINPGLNEAELAEFPWVILISRKLGGDESSFGRYTTGSLIHAKVVLASANSLKKQRADNLKAIGGEWDIQGHIAMKLLKIQDRDVERVIKHEDFNKEALHNDVALLFLVTPFDLVNHIDIICLPPVGFDFTGKQCVVSGWGKIQSGVVGVYRHILKKIDRTVIAQQTCENQLLATNAMNSSWKIHESFLCASGNRNVSFCGGDGGAPLMCLVEGGTPDQYYLTGSVAWDVKCGSNSIPEMYANIAHVREWIDSQIA